MRFLAQKLFTDGMKCRKCTLHHTYCIILEKWRIVSYRFFQWHIVSYSQWRIVSYDFFQWRIVSYFSKLPNRSLRYYGGLKVKYKNGWHTVFEPVLGHIKFLGQIKAPLMLVWGMEHPGRPKGTLYPEWSLIMTWCLILVARRKFQQLTLIRLMLQLTKINYLISWWCSKWEWNHQNKLLD